MRRKMIRLFTPVAFMALVLIFAYGCLDDEPVEPPAVSTSPVEDIAAMIATGGGAVNDDGGAVVTDRGLVWGTSPDPTLENHDGIASAGSGEGDFTLSISWLTPSTEYYVRAYASNLQGVSYGSNESFITEDVGGELLFPGNLKNSSQVSVFTWSDDEVENPGFVFGTNVYGDTGYGQLFLNEGNHNINGAFFWIGERNGTEGSVAFSIWDHDGDNVGEVLGSKTVPMGEIEAPALIWIGFDEPVNVTGNFLIGADLSDLNEFVFEEYSLGQVSSVDGEGAEAGLAMIRLSEEGWTPVLDYDIDVDLIIFPVAEMSDGGDEKHLLMREPAFFGQETFLSPRIKEVERARR